MPIRARVGRHTRSGGSHCQNWADDQKAIIDLLNRIPRTSGGTQGALNPRIVAGICSDDLYAAISAFEDKYFPGQRSGFIDPGGAMYQKLAMLAAPAAGAPTSGGRRAAAASAPASGDGWPDSPAPDARGESATPADFRRYARLRSPDRRQERWGSRRPVQ
jgi:hypothetical protein